MYGPDLEMPPLHDFRRSLEHDVQTNVEYQKSPYALQPYRFRARGAGYQHVSCCHIPMNDPLCGEIDEAPRDLQSDVGEVAANIGRRLWHVTRKRRF